MRAACWSGWRQAYRPIEPRQRIEQSNNVRSEALTFHLRFESAAPSSSVQLVGSSLIAPHIYGVIESWSHENQAKRIGQIPTADLIGLVGSTAQVQF
jgi:hypothetical protein